MAISEKIDDIIARRKGLGSYVGRGHLQTVERRIEFLELVRQTLFDYACFRDKVTGQIQSHCGEYWDMAADDPTFEAKIISASPDSVIERVNESLRLLKELRARFDRETVNISVIGRAGQGKSRLLQSISGVSNAIIPADSGSDCTGAKSVICNAPGPLRAKVCCYTERELASQVQKYLDALNYGQTLGNTAQIQQIDIEGLSKNDFNNKQESYFNRLRAYVEHYNEYSGLIGATLEVKDPSEIRQYVAQFLSDGTKVYKFLAVKEVQVFTPFNYADAGKIMLVDTIGLGDTSIGLREKMIDTLVNDSDSAILLRRPDSERDGIREEDDDLYDMINSRMGGRNIEKWLFYVLNICGNNQRTGDALYEQLCRKFGKSLKAAFIERIDCANKDAVERKLIVPMLDLLSNNLAAVDNTLLTAANVTLSACHSEFFALSEKVESLADSNFKQALSAGGLFDTLYEDELKLARRLEELNLSYKGRAEKCLAIEDEVKKSIAAVVDYCPTVNQILDGLRDGRSGAHAASLYERLSDEYRAAISERFDEINQKTIIALQEGFKNDIIEVLRDTDGGRLDAIPLKTESERPGNTEWLAAFAEQKLADFPMVREAFERIQNYRLNLEGMLEYCVNSSLDCMDPEEKVFAPIDFSCAESKNEKAELIEQGLLTAATNTFAYSLLEKIQPLLAIPYNSFCARVRKLREKLIFSKAGGRELKNFYRENATHIWRDRFAAMATKREAMQELNAITDAFAEKRAGNLFSVKL